MPKDLFEVQFRSQFDPGFEKLKKASIVDNSADPQLCWLACADMAVSRYILEPDERLNFSLTLSSHMKEDGLIDARGSLPDANFYSLADRLNSMGRAYELDFRSKVLCNPSWGQMVELLVNKGTLMVALDSKQDRHAMLMKEALFAHDGELFFSLWDPVALHQEDALRSISPRMIIQNAKHGFRIFHQMLAVTPTGNPYYH